MSGKRRRSPSDRDDRSRKRQAKAASNADDDDLEAILLQIRQQEESEALAFKLQAEWNGSLNLGESSHRGDPGSPIAIEYGVDVAIEDDETLARRLAAEWAAADSALAENAVSGPSNSLPLQRNSLSRTTSKSKGKALALSASNDTPDSKLAVYRDFFVGSRDCVKCGHEIISPRGYVTYSTQVPPPSLIALLHVHCPSCQTGLCRGCSRVIPCPPSCRGTGQNKDTACPILTCCAQVRAIALFEALGGFDRHYLGERATAASRSKEAMEKYRRSNVESIGPSGTGYGTGITGVGYAGFDNRGRGRGSGRGRGGHAAVEEPPSRLMELYSHADVIIVRALCTITSFLPAPYSDSPHDYDIIPHTATASLILASYLPELLGSLLRNDSVTDWTSRSDVYNAMLGLLRRMSDCELTLEVILGRRYEMEKSCGIEDWMWKDAEMSWAKSAAGELVTVNPLYAHFQKLTKQSKTFLSGASQLLENGQEPTEDVESIIKSTSLCGEIIAARDDLERAMKILGKTPDSPNLTQPQAPEPTTSTPSKRRNSDRKGKTVDRLCSLDLEKRYSEECERLAFHHIVFPEENGQYSTFNYADLVRSTANSTRSPKDRLHLIRELAVTATSLPPGVWVRVDEVRHDVLKVMIAGPEGTPYAGGLFEFDCFLTLDYPHKPPLMHLRTTAGGRVRFNPNLYTNGKVCLSLLGTWAGRPEEQWSTKSTLLQVFVSIQSMILIDMPYFNEPGYGQAKPDHPASVSYNQNVALHTVRWAMVEWLQDEQKTGMWADVIKTHFTLRAEKIKADIEKWARQEPRMRAYVDAGPGSALAVADRNIGVGMGKDLVDEFMKGVERVKIWESGTYTSP
ncbi:hypothetical protein BC835DRAFT_1521108 [Cytidiella melzeri]|nr:hypothetical protein BC835DRAFT_1521108 [Cytidiella melzeri]